MFKSAFLKYLVAFILIIFISFIMLSGIITSMIRTYATEEKENQLVSTSTTIALHMENSGVENIASFALSEVGRVLFPSRVSRRTPFALPVIILIILGSVLPPCGTLFYCFLSLWKNL